MIETQRLKLVPLTYDQLILYIGVDHALEHELQLNKTTRTISADLQEAFEQTILPNVADKSKNYLYSTLWTLISKAENRMVGDLCLVGEPNEKGEVEIGYGTYEDFRGNGYMSEAVGGMIAWLKTQPNVLFINAATEKVNVASYKVLQKNQFKKHGESETLFLWRLYIGPEFP